MTEIKNFGFMTAEDKAKLDSITTDTFLTKAEAEKIYMAADNETYVKRDDLKNFLASVTVDESGVTIFNAAGEPVVTLPVVAPKNI